MKTITFGCGLALLALPLSAQNYEATDSPLKAFSTTEEIMAARKSEPAVSNASYLFQGPGSLEALKQVTSEKTVPSGSEILQVSRRKVASGSESVLSQSLAELSANYRESAKPEEVGKCGEISLAVTNRIDREPSAMLEIVQTETGANPSCACEIVKAAIQTTDGDTAQVVAIVETAITTAPEHLRLISQCAIAAAPESLTEVQALLAKLDPAAGESGRSAKGAKVASVDSAQLKTPERDAANPLDLPPLFFVGAPPLVPSLVTNVNP